VQAGYPLTDDVNGYRQEGFAPSTATSTAAGGSPPRRRYLHPVMSARTSTSRRGRS
jgi:choline dehydrogenase